MLPIIVFLLFGSISLSHAGCKAPKGKDGDTFIKGCEKYKCNGRKWVYVEDVCRDSDMTVSSELISSYCPGCPSNRPYCSGICILGYKCSGICLPTDLPYPRGCALQAGELSENECKSDCQEDGSDSCNSCIGGNIPSHCKGLPTFGCFSCVGSILKAYQECSRSSNILECIKEHVSSSCIPCICSIACHLSGPDSTLCKLCSGTNDDSSLDEYYGLGPGYTFATGHGNGGTGSGTTTPPPTNPPCDAGWSLSGDITDKKCYKAYTTASAWENSLQFACLGLGNKINNLLAIPDTPEKILAVAGAVTNKNATDCWIAGRAPLTSDVNNPFNWYYPTRNVPISRDLSDNSWALNYPKLPTRNTCLTQDANGFWKNKPCSGVLCFVCQTDINP